MFRMFMIISDEAKNGKLRYLTENEVFDRLFKLDEDRVEVLLRKYLDSDAGKVMKRL